MYWRGLISLSGLRKWSCDVTCGRGWNFGSSRIPSKPSLSRSSSPGPSPPKPSRAGLRLQGPLAPCHGRWSGCEVAGTQPYQREKGRQFASLATSWKQKEKVSRLSPVFIWVLEAETVIFSHWTGHFRT